MNWRGIMPFVGGNEGRRETKTWVDHVRKDKYRVRHLRGQPQNIVVKAFGQEIMRSAIVLENPGTQKALICKAFIEYCKEFRRLWVWHALESFVR